MFALAVAVVVAAEVALEPAVAVAQTPRILATNRGASDQTTFALPLAVGPAPPDPKTLVRPVPPHRVASDPAWSDLRWELSKSPQAQSTPARYWVDRRRWSRSYLARAASPEETLALAEALAEAQAQAEARAAPSEAEAPFDSP